MKQILKLTIILFMIALAVACSEDNDPLKALEEELEIPEDSIFSVLGTIDGAYYLTSIPSLTTGSLSFVNNGTQLDADQAARIVSAGDYLYSLNYGTGLLTQLQLTTSGSYDVVKEINAGLSVGTNRPRFKLADSTTLMVYNVVTDPVTNNSDEIIDNLCTLRLASISIPDMSITNLTEFVIPQSENAKLGGAIGYHPMRVDAPVISDNKVYFGLMHLDMSDPTVPPPFRTPKQTGLETLVFDYPSLVNGTITESNAASGHTGGYRAPSMHVDENGDVYQSNWFMSGSSFDLSAGDKTVISKLTNGSYDASYSFDVSAALELATNIGNAGWFYVGNGIGYMPIQLEDEGNYYSENSWSLARIDIYNKTALQLNVPLSSLFSYESAVVYNDKFYMAISPIGGEAYIYEFDPTSDAADSFVQGLKLDGANISVEGIYN